jgi:hypothetical protein
LECNSLARIRLLMTPVMPGWNGKITLT